MTPRAWELAYGRGVFARYAVTGTEALAVLDDLVETMATRKAEFAGRVRVVPITREHPLELVEFDEIGALTKYTNRKTREAITERLALLTTQARALGSAEQDLAVVGQSEFDAGGPADRRCRSWSASAG